MSEYNKSPIKKVIPSKLETGFQQFLYKHVGKHIPKDMTPNQMTFIGVMGGVLAVVSTLLTNSSSFFFIGTIIGLFIHLIADDLDGYIARSRNMASNAGAYFDLITDILFFTFLMLAFGYTPYVSLEIIALAVPAYGIINVTAMNYIIYCNEFIFPRVGPIEAHIGSALVALCGMIFRSRTLFGVMNLNIKVSDIIIIIILIPTYYEMIRLQIQLFCRLKKREHK